MTSDAGVMLPGATDRKLGLMDAAARCIANPRYVVPNLTGPAQEPYEDPYCQRGEHMCEICVLKLHRPKASGC